MSRIKTIITALFTLVAGSSFAQQAIVDDPTNWAYEAKKISADEYELIFKLDLKDGWHIWSLKPGGDGYEIVPSFTFDKGVTPKSPLLEKGEPVTVMMEGMENKVTYLSGKVEYVQKVRVKGGQKVTGEHEYQVCDEKMCLPPKTKKFEFDLTARN